MLWCVIWKHLKRYLLIRVLCITCQLEQWFNNDVYCHRVSNIPSTRVPYICYSTVTVLLIGMAVLT